MPYAPFDIDAGLSDPLYLRHAILIYRGRARAFATVHAVSGGRDGSVIGEGRALSNARAKSLARALGVLPPQTAPTLLPPGLLYADDTQLLWWLPRGRRHLRFDNDDLGTVPREATLPHPALVFRASAGRLWVWALRGPQRPQSRTKLFQAPYWNVHDNAQVCTGNVRLPESLRPHTMAAWEAVFFDSFFTHPNSMHLVTFPGGCYQFWRTMLAGGFVKFPTSVLVPIRAKLGDLLSGVGHG